METTSPTTEMGTVTNLLRALAEAIAPHIQPSDEGDLNDLMVKWCENEGVLTENTFEPSDYDLMNTYEFNELLSQEFDPSDHGLVTVDELGHRVEQAIDETFTNNSIVIDDLVTRDDIGDIVSDEVQRRVEEEVSDLLVSVQFRSAVGEALAHILRAAVRD